MSDDPAQIGDTQGSNLASDSSTNAQNVASYLPNLPLSSRRLLSQALRGRNLEDLNLNELSQILNDIELLIKDLSEELVSDLGIRDELEYEKELKNTFISLLLSIQSRRRACSTDSGGTHSSSNSGKILFGLELLYLNLDDNQLITIAMLMNIFILYRWKEQFCGESWLVSPCERYWRWQH